MLPIDKNLINILAIASKYPTIKRIGIFGSYARGDYMPESDIDLIYEYDTSQKQSVDELLDYVENINDILLEYIKVKKIDYVWYDGIILSEDFEFRNNVLNDVIWVYVK